MTDRQREIEDERYELALARQFINEAVGKIQLLQGHLVSLYREGVTATTQKGLYEQAQGFLRMLNEFDELLSEKMKNPDR